MCTCSVAWPDRFFPFFFVATERSLVWNAKCSGTDSLGYTEVVYFLGSANKSDLFNEVCISFHEKTYFTIKTTIYSLIKTTQMKIFVPLMANCTVMCVPVGNNFCTYLRSCFVVPEVVPTILHFGDIVPVLILAKKVLFSFLRRIHEVTPTHYFDITAFFDFISSQRLDRFTYESLHVE